jgi:tetratricopeptide (TPR) repeat protein
MVLIDQGNHLANNGLYNESIEYYDGAINTLENKVNRSQRQTSEIKTRLNEVVQEYEKLNQTFSQLEREYNPESMMFKSLMMTEESAILGEIPELKLGLPEGTENHLNDVKRTGLFLGGLPGKVGIIQDTIDALKWKSGGREGHIKKMQELLKEINSTYKKYKNAKEEVRETSNILATIYANKGDSLYSLGEYSEALDAYDKATVLRTRCNN